MQFSRGIFLTSLVLHYFEENFENMKQDYIYALQNYKDYMGVREIMDQCTEHFVYGSKQYASMLSNAFAITSWQKS